MPIFRGMQLLILAKISFVTHSTIIGNDISLYLPSALQLSL